MRNTTTLEMNDIFNNVFYESLDAQVILDIEANRFLFCNKNVLSIYGYTQDEFLKLTPYDLSSEFKDHNHMENKQEIIINQGWDKFITKHKTKNGEVLDIYVKSKRLNYPDRFLLFIVLIDLNKECIIKEYYQKNFTFSKEFIHITETYQWNKENKILFKGNTQIELSNNEQKLVNLLINNLNHCITYDEIKSIFNKTVTYNSLLLTVKRIRQKTENSFIKTVYSKGYIIKS